MFLCNSIFINIGENTKHFDLLKKDDKYIDALPVLFCFILKFNILNFNIIY